MFGKTLLSLALWLTFGFQLPAAEYKTVWLVSNGFHSSLAVPKRDLPPALRTLSGDRKTQVVLFGWGAAAYYRSAAVTPGLLLRTVFLPNPSALYLVPARGAPARAFSHSDVFRLDLSSAGELELQSFLSDAFRRDASGHPIRLGPGRVPGSAFYAGRELFWFPGTCNVWVARALRRAGLPFVAARSIAASGLISQAEKVGKREQRRQRPFDPF